MVNVALCGASSGLGRHIALAILNTPHTLHILTRTPQPALASLGATVHVVDYTSASSLGSALSDIHTVISTLTSVPATLSLLTASEASPTVRRFVPSEFAVSLAANTAIELYRTIKMPVWERLQASRLESAAFRCGLFMNYLAHEAPRADEAFDGLQRFSYIVDVAQGTAKIPGTGHEPVAMTRTQDVGAFVAAALDLPDGAWGKCREMGMRGWIGTYNDVVAAVQRVTGKKLLVEYLPAEQLQAEADAKEGMEKFYVEANLALIRGMGEVGAECNELFKEVQPWGLEQFLDTYWGSGKNEGVAAK